MAAHPPIAVTFLSLVALGAAVGAAQWMTSRQEASGVPALYRDVREWVGALRSNDPREAAKHVVPGLRAAAQAQFVGLREVQIENLGSPRADGRAEVRLVYLREVGTAFGRGIQKAEATLTWVRGADGEWLLAEVGSHREG